MKTSTSKVCDINPLVIAFVQGARWWECYTTHFTMWQSDQRLAEEEALKRLENGTLGELHLWEENKKGKEK